MRLSWRFKFQQGDFKLDTEMKINVNGITGIMGPSGSGKSTFLRLLSGLESSTDNKLVFNDVVWQGHRIFVPTHTRRVSYVFQEPSLFSHLSVKDNLCFGLRHKDPIQFSFEKVIDTLKIDHLLNRSPGDLSGGEKQKVAIGRALLSQPKLLLMDEPLSALDDAAKSEILPFIKSLPQNFEVPIIYVSHSKVEIMHLAERILKMDHGKLERVVSPRNIEIPLSRASVIKVIDQSSDKMTLLVELKLDHNNQQPDLHH